MLESIRTYLKNSDIILGAGVVFILMLIVVPLPGPLLDGLIAISLISGLLILMTSMATRSPAEFSVLPTLLLVTTIYRLAVNISTTRMILSKGPASNSALVNAFGTFVVGGGGEMSSYVIGAVIFLILTLVQIMVITKGATRVSEVAARFALDSMPGKQMAIDTDQAQGHIDETEARRRRESLQQEMSFYGAMDGASKFVQGDVMLGLVITVINVIGGFIVGVGFRGESWESALALYTKYTIGDGLVSQIPALLISTATGVVVSRSISTDTFPAEIKKQLANNPYILYVTGGVMVLAGFIPGFPLIPLLTIGAGLIYLGTRIEKVITVDKEQVKKKEIEKSEEKRPESYLQHLRTEPLEVEIGFSLIPLVDPKQGGTLLDQISRIRKRFAMEYGLIVPPVRIRDNMNLDQAEYTIKLHGTLISTAKLEADKLMAINTGRAKGEVDGAVVFKEPTYQLDAYWITPDRKSEVEQLGYDVVDPSTVIATHLSNLINHYAPEIMGRQEIKSIIDSIREENPVVVDEVLTDKKVSLSVIQSVLQYLLKEGVAIRNMVKILEAIGNNVEKCHYDPYMLTIEVRKALKRQIVGDLIRDNNMTISCITLDPQIERRLREGIHKDPEEGLVLAVRPEFQIALRDAISKEYQDALKSGTERPIFLTTGSIRGGLVYMLEKIIPSRNFVVLAHEEIPPEYRVESVGEVSLQVKKEESVVS